ncbi:MAG: Shedu immune nuclease family protein [Cyclobacteriaceae bacterium]
MALSSKPTEEEVIMNSKSNHLYSHDFGDGRFFQVVHEDEDSTTIRFASRTMLKVVYKPSKDDIESLELIKIIGKDEKERLLLSKFNFDQLRAFLSFLNEIDLKGISERRLKIINEEEELDNETARKIKTLLAQKGGQEIIESLIKEGIITSRDIVNTGFRKRGLNIFKKLLDEEEYWKKYAKEEGINNSSEEKVWQRFLEKNEWIFGYGLDYRFQSILQREAHISDTELDGSESVIGDYLMGDKRFTTFVEIKKPSTPLFGTSKNRSGTWRLSNELIDAQTQILEHKSAGTIKLEREVYNRDGAKVTQKAYDSKVILIIGNWKELQDATNDLEGKLKSKTFELFRRDSRNIDIVTYDELYERAQFIVEGNASHELEDSDDEDFVTDDIPF